MSPSEHIDAAARHPRDELAAYALDAVDPDERRAIEAHLAACAACRRELAAHQEVLSRMIGDESPPPGVWDRIARQTGAQPASTIEAGRPGPTADDRPRPEGPGATGPDAGVVPLRGARPPRHLAARGLRRHRGRMGVIAAATLAAAAAVVVAVGVLPRLGDGDGAPPSTEIVAPDLPVGPIMAADGTEVARVGADDQGSYVEMVAVQPLPADRTYQMWSLDGPEPVSLGLLGRGADQVVRVDLPEGTTSVAISDEPAGGSQSPTGLIAGSGDLAVPA